MILTPKILARLVAIVILGVLLQLSFFSQVTVFQVSPDLLPALVISIGLLGGTMTGVVTGFSVGILLDCLLIEPLGGASLVLLATGYLAGLFRERYEIHSALVPPLLCMGLTIFAEIGFGAIELMLGVNASVSTTVISDILIQGLYAFVLGWPIYLGMRRILRLALVEEQAVRRPRRPTTLGA